MRISTFVSRRSPRQCPGNRLSIPHNRQDVSPKAGFTCPERFIGSRLAHLRSLSIVRHDRNCRREICSRRASCGQSTGICGKKIVERQGRFLPKRDWRVGAGDSTGRAAVEHVARLVGIEARHRDGLGRPREVSDDTLIALIEASGLPADPARAERALAEEEQEAPLGLSPVHVVPADASRQALALRLPIGCREILWSCLLESGEQGSGRGSGVEGRRDQMQLPDGLPLGYHLLDLYAGGLTARLSLIVAPERCHLPAELGPGARKWGLSCQLYGLRNGANWGIGDFSDLGRLARAAGSCTAAALGINPLHALFAAEPLHISPYSPSHRSWLNYLYIDVTVVPGFADDETVRALTGGEWFAATQAAARSSAVIDYGAVAACKRPVLELLFRRFRITEFGADAAARGRRGVAAARHAANFNEGGDKRSPILQCSRLLMSVTEPTVAPPGGADGPGRCRIRARPRLPTSPMHIATGSNSLNSCSGKPTASSLPHQQQAATVD